MIWRFYKTNPNKSQHTRFKKCPSIMMIMKLYLWVVPFRLLDIFDLTFPLVLGGGLVNFANQNTGILPCQPCVYNNEMYYPMYAIYIPFFVSYSIFVGKNTPENEAYSDGYLPMTNRQLDILIVAWLVLFPIWNIIKNLIRKM
jgi:hypothetical protein